MIGTGLLTSETRTPRMEISLCMEALLKRTKPCRVAPPGFIGATRALIARLEAHALALR